MLLLPVYRLITKVTQLLLCISCLYSLSSSSWAAEEGSNEESSDEEISQVQSSDEESSGVNNKETEPSIKEPLHYLPDIPKKRAQSLIHYMERMEREDEIVSLTGSNQDFYGLFLGDVTGRPQGGVLILHDNQQHGHWPKIVAPLREYLPHHGWATLTIELPDIPARQRIARQDLTVPSPSSDTEEASDAEEAYRKQNQQRIFTAMEYLRSKGQFNLVIIGYGTGAALAIDYINQQNEGAKVKVRGNKGLSLITIDAMPSPHNASRMDQQLTKFKIPFLDLIQPNKAYAVKQGETRRGIMKRNKNKRYQQVITSNIASYYEDNNPTNRRIRGWLKTNAAGTRIKIRR
jgi:hypothetical protein